MGFKFRKFLLGTLLLFATLASAHSTKNVRALDIKFSANSAALETSERNKIKAVVAYLYERSSQTNSCKGLIIIGTAGPKPTPGFRSTAAAILALRRLDAVELAFFELGVLQSHTIQFGLRSFNRVADAIDEDIVELEVTIDDRAPTLCEGPILR